MEAKNYYIDLKNRSISIFDQDNKNTVPDLVSKFKRKRWQAIKPAINPKTHLRMQTASKLAFSPASSSKEEPIIKSNDLKHV